MDENHWVIKSNALIENKGKMSTLEQKIFLGLISEIRIEDTDFNEYRIDVEQMRKLVGSENKAFYLELKDACKALTSRTVTIEREVEVESNGKLKKRKSFLVLSYLASAEYVDGENAVKIEIASKLKPYILQLKNEFTQYQLKNIMSMKSGYSIRIYELVKQYQNLATKKRRIDLQELKEFLGVKNEYARFYDFEKNVLKVAEQEISEQTDIVLTYEKIKKGRNIIAIDFSFTVKPKEEKYELMKELNVLDSNVNLIRENVTLSNTFNAEQVQELWEIAQERVEYLDHITPYQYMQINYLYAVDHQPSSLFGYYKKALQNDYAQACMEMMKKTGEIS